MSILVSNLNYVIGDAVLLRDVSFNFEQGNIIAIVGPNGSGKTSLLKAMNGDVDFTGGSVNIDGQSVQGMSLQARAEKFATLPQASSLDFPFVCEDVIQMGRIPHVSPAHLDRMICDQVIDELQLDEFRYRRYPTLSGGEKQRVQFARVLCQIWDCSEDASLFLDEPTAPLDLSHQLKFFRTLQGLVHSGTTVFVVLHDVNLAIRYADQVVLLSAGEVLASGLPLSVLTPENMQRAFSVEFDLFPTNESGRPFLLARA